MASIAQDEMGHARSLYACIWPDWAEREADVVRRPASEWRSCQLVELAAPSWEWALIRHWVYDALEPLRWLSIESSFGSEIEGFGALLAKAAQEERFHRHHAEQLVVKLGLANPEAKARLQHGVDSVVPLIATLVEPEQLEAAMGLLQGVAGKANLLLPSALRDSDSDSALAPPVSAAGTGSAGRVLRHADFAEVHAALLAVVSVDPIATW
jgi:ring-1,2-phenylacetyl-CoA epoxidase subunit PaaC